METQTNSTQHTDANKKESTSLPNKPVDENVVNLDSPEEQAKYKKQDEESIMDFASGSGGGSAGDGGAA